MMQVNEKYRTRHGIATCIFVLGHIAYLTFPGDETAYPYNFDGTARGLSEDWDVVDWG